MFRHRKEAWSNCFHLLDDSRAVKNYIWYRKVGVRMVKIIAPLFWHLRARDSIITFHWWLKSNDWFCLLISIWWKGYFSPWILSKFFFYMTLLEFLLVNLNCFLMLMKKQSFSHSQLIISIRNRYLFNHNFFRYSLLNYKFFFITI